MKVIKAIKHMESGASACAALTLFASTISGSLFYIWGHSDHGSLAFRIALTCVVWLFVVAVLEKAFPVLRESVTRRMEVDALLKKATSDLEVLRRESEKMKRFTR